MKLPGIKQYTLQERSTEIDYTRSSLEIFLSETSWHRWLVTNQAVGVYTYMPHRMRSKVPRLLEIVLDPRNAAELFTFPEEQIGISSHRFTPSQDAGPPPFVIHADWNDLAGFVN